MLTYATWWCAICGEENELRVDLGGGARQRLVEDCAICCRPHQLVVFADPEDGTATAEAEAES